MSKTEINFLDTTVFKVCNQLPTKIYRKLTNKQSYIHSKSVQNWNHVNHQHSHCYSTNEILSENQTENDEKKPLIVTFFRNPSVITFERNKALSMKFTIIKKLIYVKTFDKGQWQPCLTRAINLCNKQINSASYFQSATAWKKNWY